MKSWQRYLVLIAATGAVASANDFTNSKELKEAAVSSFKFTEDPPREDKVGVLKSKDVDKRDLDSKMPKADLGDVVALDPFEVTGDKIPVVTHKSASSLEKYFESGALYTHEGKKVTTRIVLDPIRGFGISFSW